MLVKNPTILLSLYWQLQRNKLRKRYTQGKL